MRTQTAMCACGCWQTFRRRVGVGRRKLYLNHEHYLARRRVDAREYRQMLREAGLNSRKGIGPGRGWRKGKGKQTP